MNMVNINIYTINLLIFDQFLENLDLALDVEYQVLYGFRVELSAHVRVISPFQT